MGFITGRPARARFLPAPPDTGLVFVRADLPGHPAIPARVEHVSGTARRTTIGPADAGVTLTEHVLAAVSGLRIDNCLIELDAPEPPGLDGSAFGFVESVAAAGVVLQPAYRFVWAVNEPVVVSRDGATIALYPPDDETGPTLRASYILDYGPNAVIPRQSFTVSLTPEAFAREVAGCRTFLLEHEAHALHRQGVGTHLTTSELLVFGPAGLIDNRLRFADEPARHKVLDVVGDLALLGADFVGRLVAYRSGHSLNVALAKQLAGLILATVEPGRPGVSFPHRRRAA